MQFALHPVHLVILENSDRMQCRQSCCQSMNKYKKKQKWFLEKEKKSPFLLHRSKNLVCFNATIMSQVS